MNFHYDLRAECLFARSRIHERIDRMALNAQCSLIKLANHKRDEMNMLVSHHRRSIGQIRRHWGNEK